MLKDEFWVEWRRLNPVYVKEDSGFWLWLGCLFKETVPGYFAPLRMVYWFLTQGRRNAGSK